LFLGDSVNLDMNFFSDSKRYCNKIWQSVRYYQLSVPDERKSKYRLLNINQIIQSKKYRLIDEWILIKLFQTVKYVNFNTNEFDFHLNVKKLREFYYSNFCDFYLESTKPIFKQTNNFELEELVWNILRNCNYYSLLMYHPIMPSITEELWHRNCGFGSSDFNTQSSSILDNSFPNTLDMNLLEEANIDNSNQVIKLIKSILYNVSSMKRTAILTERPKCKQKF
jgi:valyl-tRNA synthetase